MPASRRHVCRHACKPQACRGHAAGRGRAGPVPRGWAVKGSLRELQALEQTFPFRQHLSREVELVFLHLSASRVDAARRKDALTGKESIVPFPSDSLRKKRELRCHNLNICFLHFLLFFLVFCFLVPRRVARRNGERRPALLSPTHPPPSGWTRGHFRRSGCANTAAAPRFTFNP